MNEITKAEIRKRLGNITQLQELLFGEQIDEYNHKLEQHKQKLNQLANNSQKFQLVIEKRINQLEKNLIDKIDSVANSLERKIRYLNLDTQGEQNKIRQEIDKLWQHSSENIDFLQNSFNDNSNSLKTEITQTKSVLDRDMRLLKQQVLEKLESNLSELSTNKVSREDLAEVLFELCLKLKGTDVGIELSKSQDEPEILEVHQAHTDLMLTETQSE